MVDERHTKPFRSPFMVLVWLYYDSAGVWSCKCFFRIPGLSFDVGSGSSCPLNPELWGGGSDQLM